MTSSTDQPVTQRQVWPSAAQLSKQTTEFKVTALELAKAMNLRIKSVELAAQFKSEDPMKLAREIYKFLSDTEV